MAQAKQRYGIRTSLTETVLQQNINPMGTTNDNRYIPLGTVVGWLAGATATAAVTLLLAWAKASGWCIALWVVFGLAATGYLFGVNDLDEYRWTELPVVWRYWQEPRTIPSGDQDRVSELVPVSNVMDMRDGDRRIALLGRRYACAYSVIGTASRFLFDSTRQAVVADWDRFVARMPHDVTLTCITVKAGEHVEDQRAALKERVRALGPDADPELLELAAEQRAALDRITGDPAFNALEQVMIVASASQASLAEAVGLVERAAGSAQDEQGAGVASRILTGARLLDRGELRELLSHLMAPLDQAPAQRGAHA